MNNNNSELKADYYIDLEQNNKTNLISTHVIRENGNIKLLQHPDILSNIYTIDENGNVYNTIEDKYINWNYNKYPYVNLLCKDGGLKSIYIKDLIAYNFIANAESYLERGWKVVNIDGNNSNCNYKNIIFIDPSII